MIIYKKTDGIITTGERSINNYQSGLIRVDQKYVGLSTNEASDRTLLADGLILPNQLDNPSIDGLYIYGGAQESRNGDGFTTYQTSAYGRRIDTMVELSRTQQSIFVPTYNLNLSTTKLEVIVYNMVGTIVKKRSEVILPDELTFSDDFLTPKYVRFARYPSVESISIAEVNVNNFVIPTRTYEVKFNNDESRFIKIKDPTIQITAQRSFGEWVEYEFEAIRKPDSNEDFVEA
jgi:hypothetical protein